MATAPNLQTAGNFAVLGGSAVTNTGATIITGCDVGLSPSSGITGFPPGVVIMGTIHDGDLTAAQAQSDLTAAYNSTTLESCDVDLSGQNLGGMTLTPGVYCFTSSAQLTGILTLSGNGVYIFKIGTTLTTSSASSVVLTGGAQAGNVFWQVGSSATLGTTTAFIGTIMALTSITANTGASVNGRLLAINGAVTLDTNAITCPSAPIPPTPIPTKRKKNNRGEIPSTFCVSKVDPYGRQVNCPDVKPFGNINYVKVYDDGNKCCYVISRNNIS